MNAVRGVRSHYPCLFLKKQWAVKQNRSVYFVYMQTQRRNICCLYSKNTDHCRVCNGQGTFWSLCIAILYLFISVNLHVTLNLTPHLINFQNHLCTRTFINLSFIFDLLYEEERYGKSVWSLKKVTFYDLSFFLHCMDHFSFLLWLYPLKQRLKETDRRKMRIRFSLLHC